MFGLVCSLLLSSLRDWMIHAQAAAYPSSSHGSVAARVAARERLALSLRASSASRFSASSSSIGASVRFVCCRLFFGIVLCA